MQERKIIQLTDVEHVLKRPDSLVGGVEQITRDMFVYKDNKFKYTTITYTPGLDKILNEIIDNSVDEAIATNYQYANEIRVNIDSSTIKISDNGRGIPIDLADNSKYSQLELAVCFPRSGSNFDDMDRKTMGKNGVGSFITNCYSKYFEVTSSTKNGVGKIIAKNNLSEYNIKIFKAKSNKTGTTVCYEPDVNRFNEEKIEQVYIDLVYQRILNLSICFPLITFYFNNKKIKLNQKGFTKLFDDNAVIYDNKDIIISILPNNYDEFKYYTYVNGLKLNKGGNHIDIIINNIVSELREKLQRKHKNILPGDIKNKLSLIVFFKNFINAKFDSQSKESLANSTKEINEYLQLNEINYDKIVKDILKEDAIISPIIDAYAIKEELKIKKDIKSKTRKKIKSDKFISSSKTKDYCMIVEGDSARDGLCAALGRENIAYYALGGVPLNAYDCSISTIINSTKGKELLDLLNILELDLNGNEYDKLPYEKVVIASDSDFDGTHIAGILLGFFYRFNPKLFTDLKLYRLNLPIVAILNSKNQIEKYFMSFNEYKEYEKNNKLTGKVKYFKGLGSWKPEWIRPLIKQEGLDYFLESFVLKNDCKQYFDWWLGEGKENSDKRKEFIQKYNLDINLV